MRFDFTDEQQAIKRTAKDFLAYRFKTERVRELAEAGTYDDALWTEICELGWPGIAIAEEYGGQGLGIVELVDPLRGARLRAARPLPFLSNAAAGLALEPAGSDEQKARWLPGIASGEGARRASATPRAWLVRRRRRRRRSSSSATSGATGGRRSPREVEPSTDRRDAPLLAARLGRRGAAPGDVEDATAGCRGGRRRARRHRAAGDGDGRRVREGPQAVRPPDRRLPGASRTAARRCC